MADDVRYGMATDHAGGITAVENIISSTFKFGAHRTYESGMCPLDFNNSAAGNDVGRYMSVYSFKPGKWTEITRILNTLVPMLKSVPNTHLLKLIVHHEPWNDCTDNPNRSTSMGSSYDYRQLQRAVANEVDTINSKRGSNAFNIKLWGCMEGDAVRAGYADDFNPGSAYWDGMSWDAYCWDRYYPTRYSMQEVFQRDYDYTISKGQRFAISEMSLGSMYDNRDAWIRTGYNNWLRANNTNCVWACHWNSSDQFRYNDNELKSAYR